MTNSLGKLPLRIIVPITDWKSHYNLAPWMIKIEATIKTGLTKDSSADCFQVRFVSINRFIKKIGSVDANISDEIKIGLSRVLSIE